MSRTKGSGQSQSRTIGGGQSQSRTMGGGQSQSRTTWVCDPVGSEGPCIGRRANQRGAGEGPGS